MDAWPQDWLAAIEYRDRLAALASADGRVRRHAGQPA
jgi:hypothetical protein